MDSKITSEEDTFNALKRIPFEQMVRIYQDEILEFMRVGGWAVPGKKLKDENRFGLEALFIEYGWTYEEYKRVNESRLNDF